MGAVVDGIFKPEMFKRDVEYVVQLPPMENYLCGKIADEANRIFLEWLEKQLVVEGVPNHSRHIERLMWYARWENSRHKITHKARLCAVEELK